MQHSRLHLIIYMCALALLSLTSCHDEEPSPRLPDTGLPGVTMLHDLIIYMSGENSLSTYVAGDSLEIAKGMAEVDDSCRVVVLIDDAKSSRLCVGTRTTPLQTVRTYPGNLTMTDGATMQTLLADIISAYPARSYGLVLWSHATGWVFQGQAQKVRRRTFGVDSGKRGSADNTGLQMNIPTLRHVLEQMPHFDYIFFDACFMQCIEVAYELRHVTDYILASPAEIPGHGAPYHLLLRHLFASPAELEQAMEAYADYYETGPGCFKYNGAELSLVRTDALETLAARTRPLVQTLFADKTVVDCRKVQSFAPSTGKLSFTLCYDMRNLFMQTIPAEDFALWDQAFAAAVPCSHLSPYWTTAAFEYAMHVADPASCGGVTMFVPDNDFEKNGWCTDYHALEWYSAVGMDQTGW